MSSGREITNLESLKDSWLPKLKKIDLSHDNIMGISSIVNDSKESSFQKEPETKSINKNYIIAEFFIGQ